MPRNYHWADYGEVLILRDEHNYVRAFAFEEFDGTFGSVAGLGTSPVSLKEFGARSMFTAKRLAVKHLKEAGYLDA